MGPRLQDIQLLLCTPQKLLNRSKPQPGPESGPATFPQLRAHNPAWWPAPAQPRRSPAAPKQRQKISQELSLSNSRTSTKRNPPLFGFFFTPQGRRRVGRAGMGRGSLCPSHLTTSMHFKAHHYREKGTGPSTLVRSVILHCVTASRPKPDGSWQNTFLHPCAPNTVQHIQTRAGELTGK